MTTETIIAEAKKLDPSAMMVFYELDLTPLGGDVLRYHPGVNEKNESVVWQGNVYTPWSIEASGFDKSANAQLPRPTLRVSNYASLVSALMQLYGDLAGMKVTRKRTHARCLDAINFFDGNDNADPDSHYPDDVFTIVQKTAENSDAVEFKLSSALDLESVQLPRRCIIQNVCPWAYRGAECGYAGTDYFDANDNPTTEDLDVCGKRLSSCKARFGVGEELPYGGFPAAGKIR